MNYVLGGGIAGLVYAWFHGDHQIIAESPGGSMASQLPIGPRYLHATQGVEELVADLGLVLGEKVIVRSKIERQGVDDPAQRYTYKTRGVRSTDDIMMESFHEVYLEPTVQTVSKRLIEAMLDRVVLAKATEVDVINSVVRADRQEFRFGELVNTIPLPHFVSLVNMDMAFGGEYVKIPVRFVHCEILDGSWPWDGFDYVYFPDERHPYSRVAKQTALGREWACFEFPGLDSLRERPAGTWLEAAPANMELSKIASSVRFPYGRVISREIPQSVRRELDMYGIKMFGRFAEWQDDILTHHLIDNARLVR